MDASFAYRPAGAVARDRTHTLCAFVAAFGCLIGMQFAGRRSCN